MKKLFFLLLLISVYSCQELEDRLLKEDSSFQFQELPASLTGIEFSNTLVETEDFNILEYLYFYNGAGIAVEDFNNDGLPDLYLGSNQNADQIYFNKGNFKFENASHLFDAKELEGWTTGVNVLDVNRDGWMDIYVCKLGKYKSFQDHNKLFINQAGQKFVEAATDYGLDFSGFSTQAAFLDYDRDGDLDCYLLNHSVKDADQFKKSDIRLTRDSIAGDRFYENVGRKFIEVTAASKIFSSSVGFGLGISVADFNNDNWPDIYVGNDFHEQDYLYLNKGDKTFEEQIENSTGHTSNFSMGVASADLNNDGMLDIVSLDMKPFDDAIYKKSGGWESSQIYNYKRSFGYHHQSPRNAFQICQGINDGIPYYSEQAGLLETAATDWSWSPLIADFDNDGDQDIYITNGITKRPNDMDFINFKFDPTRKNKISQVKDIPSGAIENVYLENQGAKGFKKHFSPTKTVSNAGVVADLNLDGFPDLVVSHLNKPVSILKNSTNKGSHYLQLKLKAGKGNHSAIGSKVVLYSNQGKQMRHVQSTDGFMSHATSSIHFGLANSSVDSIIVIWPDATKQTIANLQIDTILKIQKNKALTNTLSTKSSVLDFCKAENLNFKGSEQNKDWQGSNKWALFNSNTSAADLELRNGEIIIKNSDGRMFGHVNEKNEVVKAKYEYSFPEPLRNLLEGNKITYMKGVDFDSDGDEDYFIQTEENSRIYVNNNFKYQILECPLFDEIQAAAWANLDKSKNKELVIVGHWMPITIVKIEGDEVEISSIDDSNGLWSSVYIEDINQDGAKDIIAGNFGLNHALKASPRFPLRSYTNDFDRNGSVETLITYYANDIEVPYPNQELFVSQLPAAKKKFLKAEDYVKASIAALLPTKTFESADRKEIHQLASSYFIQKENSWEQHDLPQSLQVAPIYAIEKISDNTFCFGGNLFDVDPNLGRQDAGDLSILAFKNNIWQKSNAYKTFCPLYSEVRDILYYQDKLYLSMRGDSLKLVYLNR